LWVRQVDTTFSGTAGSAATLAIGEQKTGMLASLYTVGKWSIGAVLSRTLLNHNMMSKASTAALNGVGSLTLNVAEFNLAYQATPANTTGLMVTYSNSRFVSGTTSTAPHWWQFGIGNDYSLSKRTDIYVAAACETGSGRDAIAQITLNAPSSTRSEVGVSAGLRHRF
jgi:GBP family porin